MKTNYHTHTIRCMHATGSDEDYVISAIKGGFDEIGFSDHTPWRYNSSFVAHMRMKESELEDYVNSLRSLKQRYSEIISIKIGLECEYFERYLPWLKETIEKYKLDYVIFGNHYFETDENSDYFGYGPKDARRLANYVNTTIKGMESGIYAYLAHPDLFLRGYGEFDEAAEAACHAICKRAKELDFILEYNLAGLRYSRQSGTVGYPHPKFWEIAAEYKCKAIVGVDAHNNRHLELEKEFDEAVIYLKALGLELVNEIPMRKYDE